MFLETYATPIPFKFNLIFYVQPCMKYWKDRLSLLTTLWIQISKI